MTALEFSPVSGGNRTNDPFWASASGPGAFGSADARRWFLHMGRASHPSNPYDIYSLVRTEATVRLLGASMAVGLYVVTDSDDRCRYIGKVTRSDPDGIRRRFDSHHAVALEWAAVWLLPLRDDCPDWLVRSLEAEMIGAWRPADNVQHVPGALRRARGAA